MNNEPQSPSEQEINQRYLDLAQEKINAGLDRDAAGACAFHQAQIDMGAENVPSSLSDLLIRPSTAFVQQNTASPLFTRRSVSYWKGKAASAIGQPDLKDASDDVLEAALLEYTQKNFKAV